jgi:mannonate dehydratase
VEVIKDRKSIITADPSLALRWTVVESLPVHERINSMRKNSLSEPVSI